ncbi:MAG: heme-binding domain-containing protein [Gaiella sp.]
MSRFLKALALIVVVFGAIQFVPYGRDHDNPPTVQEPAWDTERTRDLALAACFDCHSNLTNWRWYTNVAPISWLAQSDVDDGRAVLNFSEWDRPQATSPREVVDAIREGEMPPFYYRWTHSGARLSDQEQAELEAGLLETWSSSPPGRPAP